MCYVSWTWYVDVLILFNFVVFHNAMKDRTFLLRLYQLTILGIWLMEVWIWTKDKIVSKTINNVLIQSTYHRRSWLADFVLIRQWGWDMILLTDILSNGVVFKLIKIFLFQATLSCVDDNVVELFYHLLYYSGDFSDILFLSSRDWSAISDLYVQHI